MLLIPHSALISKVTASGKLILGKPFVGEERLELLERITINLDPYPAENRLKTAPVPCEVSLSQMKFKINNSVDSKLHLG